MARDKQSWTHSKLRLAALVLGIGAVSLLLAWFATLALHTYRTISLPQQFHTGDPLSDAYLAAVVKYCLRGNAIAPPEAAWLELEHQYGGTPAFALLCQRGMRLYAPPAGSAAKRQPRQSMYTAYIDDAYRQGQYDYPLLLALYTGNHSDWAMTSNNGSAPAKPMDMSQRGRALAWQARTKRMIQDHQAEDEALLRELSACAPEQALPFYLRAVNACANGDFDAVRRWLEQGNAAPECEVLYGEPTDTLLEQARRGQALGGDTAIPGTLQISLLIDFAPDWISTVYMSVLVADYAGAKHKPELLEAQKHALLRIAHANRGEPMGALPLASSALLTLAEAAPAAYGKPLLADQRAALELYRAKLQQLEDKQRVLKESRLNALDDLTRTDDSFSGRIMRRLSHGTAQSIQGLRSAGENVLLQQKYFENSIKPLLDELERFDFTTLSWDS